MAKKRKPPRIRLDGEPATNGSGRPSAFNDKISREIIRLLGNSVSRRTACLKCGIGLRTLLDWLEAGKANPTGPMGSFRAKVFAAEADAEIEVVENVQDKAAEDAWIGMAWLKQRYPERFAPKEKIEVSGDPKRPLHKPGPDLSKLSVTDLKALRDAARKARGE